MRLQQNTLFCHFGQLLTRERCVSFVGNNKNMIGRYNTGYTIVSHLQQRTSAAKKIEKLLRTRSAAEWPKPAAYTTAHYNTIPVFHDTNFFYNPTLVERANLL